MEGETPGISITPPEELGFPLTKEFLEIAFKRNVESFTTRLGTNPGDNYLSIIHAIDVVFQGDQKEYHYLIKCYPNHPGRREYLDEVNVFEKELFMYEEFFAQLKQITVGSDVEAEVCLLAPPYHGGNVVGSNVTTSFKEGPWAKENFIIMTDLRKTSGFKMLDRTAGVDITHAILVMKEIAKLHATSWAYKQKNGLKYLTSKYSCFEDSMYSSKSVREQIKPMMDAVAANTTKTVEEVLGSDHPAYKNFKEFLAANDTFDYMRKHLAPEGIDEDFIEGFLRVKPKDDKQYEKESWLAVGHGDFWVNNMLFRYDDDKDPSKPVQVTLVDFQICREACPTVDLAHFLCSSVRAELRIPNEDKLLQVYYDSFRRYCEALDVKTMPGFTIDNLKRRYRRAKLFGLLLALPMLHLILKPQEESIDLDKSEAGDSLADMFSAVTDGGDKNTKYRDEIATSVLNLYEGGVL